MKKRWILLILLLLTALIGCQQQQGVRRTEPALPESQNDITASSELETELGRTLAVSDSIYDESVKRELERYFDKTMDQLSADDLQELSKTTSFVITEPVDTLKDLPDLFPNLCYLKLTASDSMPATDWEILKNMELLKALSISTKNATDVTVSQTLLYLEITCLDYETPVAQDGLASFSVLGTDYISRSIIGNPLKFIRVLKNGKIYEMVTTDAQFQDEFFASQERKIFVSQTEGDHVVCHNILDATSIVGDDRRNRLQIIDVNFDGTEDVLIDNGHFGNQGFVTYTCFLSIGDQYIENQSFTSITNPAVDYKNQKILSTWRNWAASHSWAMYVYDGTDYVMTDCLTEEAIFVDPETAERQVDVWQYTIEKRIENDMTVTKVLNTQADPKEQIDAFVYDENSPWQLRSDRWMTLFNKGKMTDFSLYGSNDIDDTILDIINREVSP